MDASVAGEAFVMVVGGVQRAPLHVIVMEVVVIVDDLKIQNGERGHFVRLV